MDELTVFHNLELFDPQARGAAALVTYGGRILAVLAPGDPTPTGLPLREVDLGGATVVPGFVDNHVHVAGGGGARGFASRSRPLRASDLVGGSSTTVVGMLGFDSSTRTMRGLLADIKALRACGVGAYALVGSTRAHPVPTLTGSLADDIVFIDEIIGAGEISLSELGYEFDSFGSGMQYVATVASEAILAGRVSGTAGYVCLQVPPHAGEALSGLFDLVDRTGIPPRQLLPSHVNQSPIYLEQAKRWLDIGGFVDVGTGYRPDRGFRRALDSAEAVLQLLDHKSTDVEHRVMLSSDGNGVVPDSDGTPRYMEPGTLHEVWVKLITQYDVEMSQALRMVTINPADYVGLSDRGRLVPHARADFVVLDSELRVTETYVGARPLRETALADLGAAPARSK